MQMPNHRKQHGKRYPNSIKIIGPSIRLLLPPHELPAQSSALHIINQMKMTSMTSTIMKQQSIIHVQT